MVLDRIIYRLYPGAYCGGKSVTDFSLVKTFVVGYITVTARLQNGPVTATVRYGNGFVTEYQRYGTVIVTGWLWFGNHLFRVETC